MPSPLLLLLELLTGAGAANSEPEVERCGEAASAALDASEPEEDEGYVLRSGFSCLTTLPLPLLLLLLLLLFELVRLMPAAELLLLADEADRPPSFDSLLPSAEAAAALSFGLRRNFALSAGLP